MTVYRQDSDTYSAIAVRRSVGGKLHQTYLGLRRDGKLVSPAEERQLLEHAEQIDRNLARTQKALATKRRNARVQTRLTEYPRATGVAGITLVIKPKRRPGTTHYTPAFAIMTANCRGRSVGIISRGMEAAWRAAVDIMCDAENIPRRARFYNYAPTPAQLADLRAEYGLETQPGADIREWGWSKANASLQVRGARAAGGTSPASDC